MNIYTNLSLYYNQENIFPMPLKKILKLQIPKRTNIMLVSDINIGSKLINKLRPNYNPKEISE